MMVLIQPELALPEWKEFSFAEKQSGHGVVVKYLEFVQLLVGPLEEVLL
jgi:hypothetical protein